MAFAQNTTVLPNISKYTPKSTIHSSLEISCLEFPENIGAFYTNYRGSGAMALMDFFRMSGQELTTSSNQIMAEEIEMSNELYFDYPGLVTRVGKVLTLNPAIFNTIEDLNFDACQDPTNIQWLIPIDKQVRISDATGASAIARVKEISVDGLEMTLDDYGTADLDALATTDLVVDMSLAGDEDEKSCGNCIGYKTLPKYYENQFQAWTPCFSYDKLDLTEDNNCLTDKASNKYFTDTTLDNKISEIWVGIAKSTFFTKRADATGDVDVSGYGGKQYGVIEQIISQCNLNLGYIQTEVDLEIIVDYLNSINAPKDYVFICNTQQARYFDAYLTQDVQLQYNPFAGSCDMMRCYRFKGFSKDGYEFYYHTADWLTSGINNSPAVIESNPYYLGMPYGVRSVSVDGRKGNLNFFNLIFKETGGNLWKMYRDEKENPQAGCTDVTVAWKTIWSNLVLGRKYFLLGMNPKAALTYTART